MRNVSWGYRKRIKLGPGVNQQTSRSPDRFLALPE
jgi:hypothetical protein